MPLLCAIEERRADRLLHDITRPTIFPCLCLCIRAFLVRPGGAASPWCRPACLAAAVQGVLGQTSGCRASCGCSLLAEPGVHAPTTPVCCDGAVPPKLRRPVQTSSTSNVLVCMQGIAVNAVCPGWCKTDMSSNSGNKTAEVRHFVPFQPAVRPPGWTVAAWRSAHSVCERLTSCVPGNEPLQALSATQTSSC